MADGFLHDLNMWQRQIARDRRVNLTMLRILVVLGSRFNSETRDAWPSLDCLAADTGVDKRNVGRILKVAEELGVLSIQPGKGRWKPTRYKFVLQPGNGVRTDTDENGSNGVRAYTDNKSAQRCTGEHLNGVPGNTRTVSNSEKVGGAPRGDPSRTLPPGAATSDPKSSGEVSSLPPASAPSAGSGDPARAEGVDNVLTPEAKADFEALYYRRNWIEPYAECIDRYSLLANCINVATALEFCDKPEHRDVDSMADFLSIVMWFQDDDDEDRDFLTTTL